MFDESTTSATGAGAPPNLPIEPDDMFSAVDTAAPAELGLNSESSLSSMTGSVDALSAGVLKRKITPDYGVPGVGATSAGESFRYGENNPAASGASHSTVYPTKEPILGRIILFILTGLIIVGLAVGGWWVYTTFFKKITAPAPVVTPAPSEPVETTPASAIVPPTIAPVTATTSGISNEIKNDAVLFGESIDTDRDGLDDIREERVGTDLNSTDTDKDSLTDGEEVLVWKTNPLNPDTDGDSYPDGEEVQHGYNPLGAGKLTQPVPGASTTAASETRP